MNSRKKLYFMRHFEALHNIQPYNFNIPDPDLSPHGRTQAQETIEHVKSIPQIDLIVCSPLTRTIQSYLLVFADRLDIPLIIHPYLQEKCTEPCDTGSSIQDLKQKFPNLIEQLSTFDEHEWLDKLNPESIYSPERIIERCQRFLDWIRTRSEENIFVISHNLLLKQLCNQKSDFKNGEIKLFDV